MVFLSCKELKFWRGCDDDGGGFKALGQTFTLKQSERKVWQ